MTCIVFLHGFLGSKTDFNVLVDQLKIQAPNIKTYCLDLPGFGGEKALQLVNFSTICAWLDHKLTDLNEQEIILYGYSLGGRIAAYYFLYYKSRKQRIKCLFLEGSALYLKKEDQEMRYNNDVLWAKKFATQDLSQTLQAWYQQKIFQGIPDNIKLEMVIRRLANTPTVLKNTLLGLSVAKQPNLLKLAHLPQNYPKIRFFYGEYDLKYKEVSKQYNLLTTEINQAGHNSHYENPAIVIQCILCIIQELEESYE